MRGDNVMMGYLDDEEATREAFKGGWFHSGDLGVVHEDGYVELRDRLKDVIISGGENIATIEVEQALAAHESVAEAAVVGAPHERWGEVPGRVRHRDRRRARRRGAPGVRARAAREVQGAEAIVVRRRAAQDRHRQDPEVRAARAGRGGRREGIDLAAVYAAVFHEYGTAPRYEDFTEPRPRPGQVVVEVGGAAIHHFDLLKASGNFYLDQALPSVVGSDGVGVADGRRVFFDAVAPHGSMAERSVAAAEALRRPRRPRRRERRRARQLRARRLARAQLARGSQAGRDRARARRHRPGRQRRRAGGEAPRRGPRRRRRARG